MGNDATKIDVKIGVDDEQPYTPGESINGRIFLTIEKPLEITGMEVNFEGGSWWREEPGGDIERKQHVDETIKHPMPIDGKLRFSSGPQEIPFSIDVPESCKSTIVCGQLGETSYSISARVKRSGQDDLVVSQEVVILGSAADEQGDEGDRDEPIEAEDSTTVDGYSNVQMKLQLPKRIFAPGEAIPMSGRFVNKSNSHKFKINASICVDDGSGCEHTEAGFIVVHSKVKAGQVLEWNDEEFFRLPTTTPTESSLFQRFRNRRRLVVAMVDRSNQAKAIVKVELPIQIGN